MLLASAPPPLRGWWEHSGDLCHYGGQGLRLVALAAVVEHLTAKHPHLIIRGTYIVQEPYNYIITQLRTVGNEVSYAELTEVQQQNFMQVMKQPDSHMVPVAGTDSVRLLSAPRLLTLQKAKEALADLADRGAITYKAIMNLDLAQPVMYTLLEQGYLVPLSRGLLAYRSKPFPPFDKTKLRQWLA